MVRGACTRESIGRRVLLPSPSPPAWRVRTVQSRGGLNRRLVIRLQFCEVRVLVDVGDEGVGEESGEVWHEGSAGDLNSAWLTRSRLASVRGGLRPT
jgi:hypothetical protein